MVKKILLWGIVVLLVVVVGFVIIVMLQPNEFNVVRSTTIDAPPEAVFPHVNDFHKWNAWNPWLQLDPDAKITYKGPEQGEGAEYHWDGDDKMGAGSMKILESKPPEMARYELKFIRPYEDTCEVEFHLQPDDDGTKVDWRMHGDMNFMAKAMCLFMDMDAMVGGDFERGLANLKKEVEKEPVPVAPLEANEGDESNDAA